MKILHICSDFAKQSIYDQLVTHLSSFSELHQYIYVPTRTIEEVGKFKNDSLQNVDYFYKHLLNKSDRILYHQKIKKTTNYIKNQIAVSEIDLIHAHFLFSDGGIALEYFKKFGTPYIVAVRNTDLNMFFKYMIHLRKKGVEILVNASKIVFLSHAYKSQLFEKYLPNNIKNIIESKSVVIPNGVDSFWLKNIFQKSKVNFEKVNVLYVGEFTKNKNVQASIDALNFLRQAGYQIIFTIVGGGGDYSKQLLRLIKNKTDWIRYVPRTNNKETLLKLYRDADVFCMPSKLETFGVVYVEAMSQGLPIIYTKGQGIDGYFKQGEIGYAVESSNINEIGVSLLNILNNYHNISSNCSKFACDFSWVRISSEYRTIYKSIFKNG